MAKVTFHLSKHIAGDATGALLIGEFNNWDSDKGIPLEQNDNGSLTVMIDLQPGTYQYRYLLNDGRWENDDKADHYAAAHGLQVENCVVVVTENEAVAEPVKAPAKKAAAKKTATAKPKTDKVIEIKKDDLTKISGITKTVGILLNKHGINTFSQLSKASVKKLKEVLEAGGAKFAGNDPAGWAKAAKEMKG